MSDGTKRAHVVGPDDLLHEVDALVGPRGRSQFFDDAVRDKVARERLRKVAHELAGSLSETDIPGWETPQASSGWVRALRSQSDDRAFLSAEQD